MKQGWSHESKGEVNNHKEELQIKKSIIIDMSYGTGEKRRKRDKDIF